MSDRSRGTQLPLRRKIDQGRSGSLWQKPRISSMLMSTRSSKKRSKSACLLASKRLMSSLVYSLCLRNSNCSFSTPSMKSTILRRMLSLMSGLLKLYFWCSCFMSVKSLDCCTPECGTVLRGSRCSCKRLFECSSDNMLLVWLCLGSISQWLFYFDGLVRGLRLSSLKRLNEYSVSRNLKKFLGACALYLLSSNGFSCGGLC